MTMRKHKYIPQWGIWCLLLMSDTIAQLLIKTGAKKLSHIQAVIGVNWQIFLGYSLIIVSFFSWMFILKTQRLVIAQATGSLLYVTVAICSWLILNEHLTLPVIMGTLCISVGVLVINVARGED